MRTLSLFSTALNTVFRAKECKSVQNAVGNGMSNLKRLEPKLRPDNALRFPVLIFCADADMYIYIAGT